MTRKSLEAVMRQWPVPVGRTAMSPAWTVMGVPFSPPRMRSAWPAAKPRTSCAVEW